MLFLFSIGRLLRDTCIALNGRLQMPISIRLPAELEARLDTLAKATGRTKTYYAKQAISEYIDDLEDLYLAERELEAIRAGKSQTVPLEEVMKRYGMES